SLLLTPFFFFFLSGIAYGQLPSTEGFTCAVNQTALNQCQTYVFYRSAAPDFLDLASISDLFSVSRLMIARPSNIISPSSPLIPGQALFVPIACSCNQVNSTFAISYSPQNYTILSGDTYYLVSTIKFENLTTYQSVEVVNPTYVPTLLSIGTVITFPIFCKCPDPAQSRNSVNLLISYVFQPGDDFTSIASRFGSTVSALIGVNGNSVSPFQTIFIPVASLPNLPQPVSPLPSNTTTTERKGTIVGLAIGLGICGFLLILVSGIWCYRESLMRRKLAGGYNEDDDEIKRAKMRKGVGTGMKGEEANLMVDVSGYLDKYRLFDVKDLRDGTDGFDRKWLIQGSVYKGCVDGEWFAIKKMKWNAYEELKILQKVNHGNLVKLEGFCIDSEEANCYLVYEYVENGSLYSWLHEKNSDILSWKTRLGIAIDVANGLQYIHEHTRPKVVHKDIKSSNILLDSTMRAKIANFGLAKSGCNAITMHIVGTQGYMAPEYLADGVVSTKMDVFAFGVVLLELVSGREALDGEGNALWLSAGGLLKGGGSSATKRVREWVDQSVLKDETVSFESVMRVVGVAVACLGKDPAMRPSMIEIVYALSKSDSQSFDMSETGLSPRGVVAR
ncbi:hypothetical protein M569_11034, partial [Genlisea aurea]